MSPSRESLCPADLRIVARQDWYRIHVMLADGAGLFLQQALEKFLKAYLLIKGRKTRILFPSWLQSGLKGSSIKNKD